MAKLLANSRLFNNYLLMVHKIGSGSIILLLAGIFLSFHPFYLSVTELSYNPVEKKLQISCKLFTDDIENTIRKSSKSYVDLLNPNNKSNSEKLLIDYIQKHLTIRSDDKPIPYRFLGYEKEEEAIWCYFESEEIQTPKKLDINNSLLYEYLPEQFNIVHVNVSGNRQSSKVNNPESKLSFRL